MVYSGPWIQGADYTRSPAYLWGRVQAPNGDAGFDGGVGDGVAPYNDEMNDALDQTARTRPTTRTLSGIGAGLEVTDLHPYATSVTVGTHMWYGGGYWDAIDLRDLAYYAAILEPTKPADAYGVEYETNTVGLVAANLHLEIVGGGRDTSLPTGAPATEIDASLVLAIKADNKNAPPTSLAQLRVSPGMAPVAFEFDLTWLMGSQGECAIITECGKDTPWHYYDPNTAALISASAAATQNTQMVYTLHPPRHRWLYSTPPTTVLPPLRQHPRRDGLGASTARRHYPPDRSVQASNRHRGGYY